MDDIGLSMKELCALAYVSYHPSDYSDEDQDEEETITEFPPVISFEANNVTGCEIRITNEDNSSSGGK